MSFNQWLHAIVVRPFGPLIPDLVKRVVESLELEDVKIELDLEKHSKQRSKAYQQSRKRKVSDLNFSSQPCSSAEQNKLVFLKPPQQTALPAFKRRQLL